MKTILFQGDSITDAERGRDSIEQFGYGYARLVKGQLGLEYPGEYNFINRGVSGNRILELYSRIVSDIINVKPDYMSILIGVNDVWHGIDNNNGTGFKRYEKVYNLLLDEIKEELPNTKIMILEPFVLYGPSTENTEALPTHFDEFKKGVTGMAEIAKRVAKERDLVFIPLQEKFDEAEKKAPATTWLADGVHPTAQGHEIIKREWLKHFELIK